MTPDLESLYLEAIKNQLKIKNLHELEERLASDQIGFDAYNDEINNHPEKYVIEMKKPENIDIFVNINYILKKLNITDIDADEVEVLFGVDLSDYKSQLLT